MLFNEQKEEILTVRAGFRDVNIYRKIPLFFRAWPFPTGQAHMNYFVV